MFHPYFIIILLSLFVNNLAYELTEERKKTLDEILESQRKLAKLPTLGIIITNYNSTLYQKIYGDDDSINTKKENNTKNNNAFLSRIQFFEQKSLITNKQTNDIKKPKLIKTNINKTNENKNNEIINKINCKIEEKIKKKIENQQIKIGTKEEKKGGINDKIKEEKKEEIKEEKK